MTENANKTCADWYSTSYGHSGFSAQRRYPNEELLRFFGRHYFPLPRERRREIRVLEVGCGSGANLWMIAREGFDAHGIDLAPEGISLCAQMLEFWGTQATLTPADMTDVPYPDSHFDAIVDVFSSYCIDEAGFEKFLDEVSRLLKPGGRIYVFEHNPRNPLVRYVIARTPIDENAILLDAREVRHGLLDAARYDVETDYLMFMPPGIGFLAPIDRTLAWLPLGAQYVVAARKAA